MSKRHLDKLFQDKLRDFSEEPEEKVWDAIEATLEGRKNSRPLIPFWWKLGGAAALLALLVYLFSPGGQAEINSVPSVTESPTLQQPLKNKPEAFPTQESGGEVQPALVKGNAGDESRSKQKTEPSAAEAKLRESPGGKTQVEETEDGLAVVRRTTDVAQDPSAKGTNPLRLRNPESAVAAEATQQSGNGLLQSQITSGEEQTPEGSLSRPSESELAGQEGEAEEVVEKGRSLFEVLEEEEELAEDSKAGRWSVGPSVAPVYFNSLGDGSPIHSSFATNSKSGKVNMSYGITVAYLLSDKLSLRSGLHRVDNGYDTNDISFTSSLLVANGGQLNTINYELAASNLQVRNITDKAPASFATDVSAQDPARTGRMVQQLEYLEVPLELNYALVDKKLGVALIGGFSSLFLLDNSVTLESNGSATELGEANNISTTNFSTNIGVGVNYEVAPSLQLSVEPLFKYQLNTFAGNSGNFKPYTVGVYSGLQYKF